MSGTDVVRADLDDDLRLRPDAAAEAVARTDPDVICVANPSNPTGLPVDPGAVRALHDAGRALVVVDEAYVEFGATSALRLLADLPRLVVTRTFSKAWRLAGLRLGYCYAPGWVVDDLRRVRLPYHLDALTQTAGLLACEMADTVTDHVGRIVAERDRLAAALAALPGVEVGESAANFLLVRTGVEGLFARLLDRGVLVRDFSQVPRLEGCVRITVGTAEENDAVVAAVRDVLETGEEA